MIIRENVAVITDNHAGAGPALKLTAFFIASGQRALEKEPEKVVISIWRAEVNRSRSLDFDNGWARLLNERDKRSIRARQSLEIFGILKRFVGLRENRWHQEVLASPVDGSIRAPGGEDY